MKKTKILVVGALGQLGQEFKQIAETNNQFKVNYTDVDELDITDKSQVTSTFKNGNFDYCLNCSAYTAVDKAENDRQRAFAINAEGVNNLAEVCSVNKTKLIHISTDFVFDGKKNTPYTEDDETNPINIYGESKLKGEKLALNANEDTMVVRTSWLYSNYGNNFVKTMLRLAKEKDELGVICDQLGTPTNAMDLAAAMAKIIEDSSFKSGIYHYSNEGVASWYDFAHAIFDINNIKIKLNPIRTAAYPTPAKRPVYSVMDKSKFKKAFGVKIGHWKESLGQKCDPEFANKF